MTGTAITLQKAVLIPMDDAGQPLVAEAIAVQFNPESLKVTLSNTLKTDNQGGQQASPAQFVDKSESSLTVQLTFDTTVGRADEVTFDAGSGEQSVAAERASHAANSDVRLLTKRIAEAFMNPRAEGDKLKAPRKCRFQWGAFAFVGLMSSYDETLDFFAPEGVPLRATLSIGLKEDRFQFENVDAAVGDRANPSFAPGGDAVPSIPDAAKNAGKNPKDWRNTALFNGIETPRLSVDVGLSLPQVSISAQATLGGALTASVGGFSGGLSASLGTDIPGAFNASIGLPGLSASGTLPGISASASVGGGGGGLEARASLGGGPSASLSAGGRFASASAMAAGGIAAGSLSVNGSAAGGIGAAGAFSADAGTFAGGFGAGAGGAGGGAFGATASAGGGFDASASAGSGGAFADASAGFSGGGFNASASASADGALASATADFDFNTG